MMMQHSHSQRLFVSYSRTDAEWVRTFVHGLAMRGFDVWSEDFASDHAGDTVGLAVANALRDSDVLIPVLSERSLENANTWFELGAAMAGGKAVMPIVSRDADVSRLPLPLQRVVFVTKDSPDSTAAKVANGLLKAS